MVHTPFAWCVVDLNDEVCNRARSSAWNSPQPWKRCKTLQHNKRCCISLRNQTATPKTTTTKHGTLADSRPKWGNIAVKPAHRWDAIPSDGYIVVFSHLYEEKAQFQIFKNFRIYFWIFFFQVSFTVVISFRKSKPVEWSTSKGSEPWWGTSFFHGGKMGRNGKDVKMMEKISRFLLFWMAQDCCWSQVWVTCCLSYLIF